MASFLISTIPIVLIGLILAGLLKMLRTKSVDRFLNKKVIVTRGPLVSIVVLLVCLLFMSLLKLNVVVIYILLGGVLASILMGKHAKR
jgi:hypothetical protein